jgi:lysophospholipase L1-like esterase
LAHRDLDLLILAFGGNEAADGRYPIAHYERETAEVIRHMRAGHPALPCLVFAPLDQAEHDDRGDVRSMSSMEHLVEGQRRAAAREGCGFFDTWQAMGGEGAMRSWFRARPRLAFPDYRHATPAGYEVIGNMFYKALLDGFADWLARRR